MNMMSLLCFPRLAVLQEAVSASSSTDPDRRSLNARVQSVMAGRLPLSPRLNNSQNNAAPHAATCMLLPTCSRMMPRLRGTAVKKLHWLPYMASSGRQGKPCASSNSNGVNQRLYVVIQTRFMLLTLASVCHAFGAFAPCVRCVRRSRACSVPQRSGFAFGAFAILRSAAFVEGFLAFGVCVRCVRYLSTVYGLRSAFESAFGGCVRLCLQAFCLRSVFAFGLRSVLRVRCHAFGLRSVPDAKLLTKHIKRGLARLWHGLWNGLSLSIAT